MNIQYKGGTSEGETGHTCKIYRYGSHSKINLLAELGWYIIIVALVCNNKYVCKDCYNAMYSYAQLFGVE